MSTPTVAKRQDAVQQVVREVSSQIYLGQLRPGDTVGELEVAERLGVSRTPVREAMGQLVARGLLEKESGKSARVRRPSLAELIELYDMRIMLESAAAAVAAEVRSDADVQRLVELEQMLLTCSEDDWLGIHREFHVLIVAASKRPKLTHVIEELRTQSEVYIWLGRLDTERQEHAPAEHRQLMEAIRDGQPESAREVMAAHLRHTVETVTRIAQRTNGQLIPLD